MLMILLNENVKEVDFLSFLEDRITAASRYIGSFPNYAKESVNVLIYECY